jgi:hypothetical protein
MNSVFPALNGPVTTIFTVCIAASLIRVSGIPSN